MKYMLHYMKQYRLAIVWGFAIKFSGTLVELFLPLLLEHLVDDVAPKKAPAEAFFFGGLMILVAIAACLLNIIANRKAAKIAMCCTRALRQDLFSTGMRLTGEQFDAVTLPSLISRMTSDSYNVQNFIGMIQRLGVRAPIMLTGSIIMALLLDPFLALCLICMVPLMGLVIYFVTRKGIPLFQAVQDKVDILTRILRENITGIRVVKALSRESYETARYEQANTDLTNTTLRAGLTMALPNPIMQLSLNVGLTCVVMIGAYRVNSGMMEPGVILAFLTYFNMVLQAILGLNRVFLNYSKAGASANRIGSVLELSSIRPKVISAEAPKEADADYIRFSHVSFSYPSGISTASQTVQRADREYALTDLNISLKRGESLGILGATGCGKTTILNLLLRFYDASEGTITFDGKNVLFYEPGDIRKRIGIVFQSDTIFRDTLYENIRFGRDLTAEQIHAAAKAAEISSFIEALPEGYDYMAARGGVNLSGGQRQRILIARALAGNPELLILDDATSALDYRTEALLRRALHTQYSDATRITIAQRISSVQDMSKILVLDGGVTIGYGTHKELLSSCAVYRDIYESQMGGAANGTV